MKILVRRGRQVVKEFSTEERNKPFRADSKKSNPHGVKLVRQSVNDEDDFFNNSFISYYNDEPSVKVNVQLRKDKQPQQKSEYVNHEEVVENNKPKSEEKIQSNNFVKHDKVVNKTGGKKFSKQKQYENKELGLKENIKPSVDSDNKVEEKSERKEEPVVQEQLKSENVTQNTSPGLDSSLFNKFGISEEDFKEPEPEECEDDPILKKYEDQYSDDDNFEKMKSKSHKDVMSYY